MVEITHTKIDVDSRALLKQMAAENRISMIEQLKEMVREAWNRRAKREPEAPRK